MKDTNNRAIKVSARVIDPTCHEQMIREHLSERKQADNEVVNVKKGKGKSFSDHCPFSSSFDTNEDIKKICYMV